MVRLIDPLETCFSLTDPACIFSNGEKLPKIDGIIPRVGVQSAGYVLSLVHQFETVGIVSLNTSAHMAVARNKLRTLQTLAKANIPIPKTVYGSFTVASEVLLSAVGGAPVIIKTLDGSQGVGVMLAPNESQATSVMDVLKQAGIEFILQTYIQESQGYDIRCFVIGDQVVAAMKRQGRDGEFRSNLHRGGTAETYTLSESERTLAITATKAVGLSVAGVDMIASSSGMCVIEVNCSPGLEGIENTLNIDIATLIVDHLVEKIQKRT